MGFIDKKYYLDDFNGMAIPDSELCRLIDVASTMVGSLMTVDVPGESTAEYSALKKATAYQVECLYEQGGLRAINGFADGFSAGSESLGSYSVSSSSTAKNNIPVMNGVPVSPIAVTILKESGLMIRWAYANRYKRKGLV